jgi:hypothetical protein
LDIDQLDRRESPTSFFAVDPITASMVTFTALHEPLPPIVQITSRSKAASVQPDLPASSSPSPFFWGRTSSSLVGDDGAFTTATASTSSSLTPRANSGGAVGSEAGPSSLLATLSGSQFSPDLEPLPNPQAPFMDPLGIDFPLLKSKPILSGDLGLSPNRPPASSDAGGSTGSSGSSTSGANTGSSIFDSTPQTSPFGSSLALPPGALAANSAPAANATRLAPPVSTPGSDLAPSPLPPVSPSGPLDPGKPPKPHKKADPLWVLDANKAIVVTPGTTENEFSNTAMDLRMQVSGATVSTYSWDLTNAPDTTGVSGSSTYNLTFTWKSFTGAAKTETIVAKETPQGGSQVTQTLTFLVAGTNSPAWSTAPTSFSTWPNVLTPDTLITGQQTVPMFG